MRRRSSEPAIYGGEPGNRDRFKGGHQRNSQDFEQPAGKGAAHAWLSKGQPLPERKRVPDRGLLSEIP